MQITITDFPARLQGYLSEKLGIDRDRLRISGIRNLAGGASRDTWTFDLEVLGEPELQAKQGLVLRRDRGGEIDPQALSREGEFLLLQAAHAGGVQVPRPRWLCTDPTILGAAFFVMDRLEGESVGRRIVRDRSLDLARAQLPHQLGEQLARIHALESQSLDFLPRPEQGQTPAEAACASLTQQLTEYGEPHPVLELALRWLVRQVPARQEVVLVHGDFRVGNLMVGAEGLVGVFDWEFAHLGDPHEDLAWPCVRAWRFGVDALRFGGVSLAEPFFAAYEAASGRTVDPEIVRYWEVVGNLRWAVGCLAQARRHLSGEANSVEFASLGRKTAEMEWELLELLTELMQAELTQA